MTEQTGNQTDPEQEPGDEDRRRPYAPPQIRSIELLETAAGSCDGGLGGPGKAVPFPCSTGGS